MFPPTRNRGSPPALLFQVSVNKPFLTCMYLHIPPWTLAFLPWYHWYQASDLSMLPELLQRPLTSPHLLPSPILSLLRTALTNGLWVRCLTIHLETPGYPPKVQPLPHCSLALFYLLVSVPRYPLYPLLLLLGRPALSCGQTQLDQQPYFRNGSPLWMSSRSANTWRPLFLDSSQAPLSPFLVLTH